MRSSEYYYKVYKHNKLVFTGYNQEDIAEHLNMSVWVISRYFTVVRKGYEFVDCRKELGYIEAYDAESGDLLGTAKTMTDIGKQFGLSTSRVSSYLSVKSKGYELIQMDIPYFYSMYKEDELVGMFDSRNELKESTGLSDSSIDTYMSTDVHGTRIIRLLEE